MARAKHSGRNFVPQPNQFDFVDLVPFAATTGNVPLDQVACSYKFQLDIGQLRSHHDQRRHALTLGWPEAEFHAAVRQNIRCRKTGVFIQIVPNHDAGLGKIMGKGQVIDGGGKREIARDLLKDEPELILGAVNITTACIQFDGGVGNYFLTTGKRVVDILGGPACKFVGGRGDGDRFRDRFGSIGAGDRWPLVLREAVH